MAVSINWDLFFVGVFIIRAQLLGVYSRAPEFCSTIDKTLGWYKVGLGVGVKYTQSWSKVEQGFAA